MNQLIQSQSLYLQQHAHNPVHWQMWGAAAFEKARLQDKPVLVSIGYAACHWCHVMERESFENEQIAALMNEYFICIKVDREEHPDVDHMYMDALQAMRQQGGWPLNIFVTPDKKPFYGGTYFPPASMYGRPSWEEVIRGLHHLWHTDRAQVTQQSEQLFAHLHQVSSLTETHVQQAALDHAAVLEKLWSQSDEMHGGFGMAPKFPSTMIYQYMMGANAATAENKYANFALFSLNKMLHAGIYDKVHGGLSRYATDEAWMIPHFEKMLYDNALFISALAEAYAISANPVFEKGIRATIHFCQHFLLENKGYKSAIDADSEGVEGKYYTFTWEALTALDAEKYAEILSYYNCTPHGNWEQVNILHASEDLESYAIEHELDYASLVALHDNFIRHLNGISQQRVPPAIDGKQQLSWNALMNKAYSDAYAALGDAAYLAEAIQHMDWMRAHFYAQGNWCHLNYETYTIAANADDWAYLMEAMIRLAEVSGQHRYWQEAKDLLEWGNDLYTETAQVFYYFTNRNNSTVPIRKIETHDTAQPSVNAVMCGNLMKLGLVYSRHDWIERSWVMFKRMQAVMEKYPAAFGYWLKWSNLVEKGEMLQIVGPEGKAILPLVNARFLSHVVPIVAYDGSECLPALEGKTIDNTGLKMYSCTKEYCSSPFENIQDWLEKKC